MELVLKDTEITLNISDIVFGCAFNEALIHQIIVSYKSNARQSTKSQKNRSTVRGSNKKPWRQKGTGRARAGSKKSPLWRSGGVTFVNKNQDFTCKVNKKMYRGALKSIFSELIRQNRLIVFKHFSIEEPKTKFLVRKLKNLVLDNVLIITHELDKYLLLASRILSKVEVRNIKNIDPISLIKYKKTIITVDAIKQIEEMLA